MRRRIRSKVEFFHLQARSTRSNSAWRRGDLDQILSSCNVTAVRKHHYPQRNFDMDSRDARGTDRCGARS